MFLASGPITPRTGDILIALSKDREKLEAILKEDPYHLAEITNYDLIEFTPVKHRDEIKDMILSTEGKLC